jgi:scyllo-inositol 2-dehydrogenase (NADP+)
MSGDMRVVVVGLGIQGAKRLRVAGTDVVATVDPVHAEAAFRDIRDVPPDSYDAALVCTPDGVKMELLTHLLSHGKHVLVEKPLIDEGGSQDLLHLAGLARANAAVCYTAYNHRFEPHFVRMKRLLDSGVLGRIYRCRMFYGNGTARDVRNSAWRDRDPGVLPDLGSHLLDTVLFWFGRPDTPCRVVSCNRFENLAFDHVVVGALAGAVPEIELEMTLLSWRNHFTCDIFAENGSAHIDSLCKWGPSTFTHRRRKLPSGRPDEEATVLVQPDPTWDEEYAHFKALCAAAPQTGGGGNIDNDLWLNDRLNGLAAMALEKSPA